MDRQNADRSLVIPGERPRIGIPRAVTWMAPTAVLCGGHTEAERERSQRTGLARAAALNRLGIPNLVTDCTSPTWKREIFAIDAKVVLLALERCSIEGEEVREHLARHGLRYSGSDAVVAEITADPVIVREAISALGYPLPPGQILTRERWCAGTVPLIEPPLVIRAPRQGRHGGGTWIVRENEEPHRALEAAFAANAPHVLVEEWLCSSWPVVCVVIGVGGGRPRALPVALCRPVTCGELILTSGACDRYADALIGAELDETLRIQTDSVALFEQLGLAHCAQYKWFLTPNGYVFHGVKLLPDERLLSEMLDAAEIPYDEFVRDLLIAVRQG